jgi:hypothetical protein
MRIISCTILFISILIAGLFASEYETYANQKFIIYHENQLGQYYVDTTEVISKTERKDEIFLRGENGNSRTVRPPDYIIKLED